MRRIARLPQPSAVLTQCLLSSSTAVNRATAAAAAAATTTTTTTTSLVRTRDFSATPRRPFHSSQTWAKETSGTKVEEEMVAPPATKVDEAEIKVEGAEIKVEGAETKVEEAETKVEEAETKVQVAETMAPVVAKAEAERTVKPIRGVIAKAASTSQEYIPVEDILVKEIESDIVIPPTEREVAPRQEDLLEDKASRYKPAMSTKGLEVVGGLSQWFQKEQHLPQSKLRVERFAPEHTVTDPALVELCVRRAVLEAMAMAQTHHAKSSSLIGTWGGKSSRKAGEQVHRLEVVFDEKGHARVESKELVDQVVADLSALDDIQQAVSLPNPPKAARILSKLSVEWKQLPLNDVRKKFAIIKRIYQLTGIRVPDAKLMDARSVKQLLELVIKPPPPRNVFDTIKAQGTLTKLPNVEVRGRRRTPITEAKKVGRWKVIKEMLEKRGLPVTGEGGVGKFVEDEWFRGPTVAKKSRKRT